MFSNPEPIKNNGKGLTKRELLTELKNAKQLLLLDDEDIPLHEKCVQLNLQLDRKDAAQEHKQKIASLKKKKIIEKLDQAIKNEPSAKNYYVRGRARDEDPAKLVDYLIAIEIDANSNSETKSSSGSVSELSPDQRVEILKFIIKAIFEIELKELSSERTKAQAQINEANDYSVADEFFQIQQLLQKAIRLDPTHPESFLRLANLEIKQRNWKRAEIFIVIASWLNRTTPHRCETVNFNCCEKLITVYLFSVCIEKAISMHAFCLNNNLSIRNKLKYNKDFSAQVLQVLRDKLINKEEMEKFSVQAYFEMANNNNPCMAEFIHIEEQFVNQFILAKIKPQNDNSYAKAYEYFTSGLITEYVAELKKIYQQQFIKEYLQTFDNAADEKTAIEAFLARTNYEEGDFAKAIENCSSVLEHLPNDTETLRLRGLSYTHIKNWELALNDFLTLIPLQPLEARHEFCAALAIASLERNDIEAQTMQARAHFIAGMQKENVHSYLSEDERSRLIGSLRELTIVGVEKLPADCKLDTAFFDANVALNAEQYAKAIALYSRYIESAPFSPLFQLAFSNLGLVYQLSWQKLPEESKNTKHGQYLLSCAIFCFHVVQWLVSFQNKSMAVAEEVNRRLLEIISNYKKNGGFHLLNLSKSIDEEIEILTTALLTTPQNAIDMLYARAKLYEKMNDPKKVLQDLFKVISLDAPRQFSKVKRFDIFKMILKIELNISECKNINDLTKSAKKDVLSLIKKAKKLISNKQFAEAKNVLVKALELHSTNSIIFLELGEVSCHLGNYKEAENYFQVSRWILQAIEINDEGIRLYEPSIKLRNLSLMRGDLANAVKYHHQSTALCNEKPIAEFNKDFAAQLLEKSKLHKADQNLMIQYLQMAVKLDPQSNVYLEALLALQKNNKKEEAALSHDLKASPLPSQSIDLLNHSMVTRSGDEKSNETSKKSKADDERIGLEAYRQGKEDEALRNFDKVLNEDPNNAIIRFLRVKIYSKSKDKSVLSRAKKDLLKLIKDEPQNSIYDFYLAKYYSFHKEYAIMLDHLLLGLAKTQSIAEETSNEKRSLVSEILDVSEQNEAVTVASFNKACARLLYQRGQHFYQQKDFYPAEIFFQYALKILEHIENMEEFEFGQAGDVHMALAILYREKNKINEALFHVSRANEMHADGELVKRELELLNKKISLSVSSDEAYEQESVKLDASDSKPCGDTVVVSIIPQVDKQNSNPIKAEEQLKKLEKERELAKRIQACNAAQHEKNERKREKRRAKRAILIAERNEQRKAKASAEEWMEQKQKDSLRAANEKAIALKNQADKLSAEQDEMKRIAEEKFIAAKIEASRVAGKKPATASPENAEEKAGQKVALQKLLSAQTAAEIKESKPYQWPDVNSKNIIARIELTPFEQELMQRMAKSGASVFMTGSTVRDRALQVLEAKNTNSSVILYRKKDQDIDFVMTSHVKFIYKEFPEARSLLAANSFRIDGSMKVDINLSAFDTMEADANNRCLTVNTLMADLDGYVYAILPAAYHDLLAHQLNTVLEPEAAFNKDPFIAFRALKVDADPTTPFKMSEKLKKYMGDHASFLRPSEVNPISPDLWAKQKLNYAPMRLNHWILSHLTSEDAVMVFDTFLDNDMWKKLFPSFIATQLDHDRMWIRAQLKKISIEQAQKTRLGQRFVCFDDVYMILLVSTLCGNFKTFTLQDAISVIKQSELLSIQFRNEFKLPHLFHKWCSAKVFDSSLEFAKPPLYLPVLAWRESSFSPIPQPVSVSQAGVFARHKPAFFPAGMNLTRASHPQRQMR